MANEKCRADLEAPSVGQAPRSTGRYTKPPTRKVVGASFLSKQSTKTGGERAVVFDP